MTLRDDKWVMFAKWTLGDVTDHEYADYLEGRDDVDLDDPMERLIIDRLRSGPPDARYTDVRSPGETPADAIFLEREP